MIWIYILGGLLALFLLICLIRIGVTIAFEERVTLDIQVGLIRIHIDPAQPKKEKKQKKPKEKKEVTAKDVERLAGKLPKPTLSELKEAAAYFKPVLQRTLRRTRRSVRIHPLTLSITLGAAEDPANLAQIYGYANAGMWAVMPWLEQLLVIPDPRIHLGLDFDSAKTVIRGRVGVSILLGDVFLIGLGAGLPALKWFLHFKKTHKSDKIEQTA